MIISILFFIAHSVLMTIVLALLVLVLVLLAEVLASLSGSRHAAPAAPTSSCSYVIIIPAHDEVGTIETTLAAALGQTKGQGRVLVVADNCTDETASVSAAAGATVVARHDPSRRGKGYALGFAVRSLAADPPDVVVVLDADCIPTEGTIERLVASCERLGQPLQARYEIIPTDGSGGPIARVGAFAWRVKNLVRPTGLSNLGLPCLLMGTGMVFPWAVLAKTDLETGHLVEDMVLGLELTAEGYPPRFLPEACVQSLLPTSVEGQTSQRARWETGHLQVISQLVPRFLLRGLISGNIHLFTLALHAAVPPLAFLALALTAVVGASALLAAAGGPSAAFMIALAASFGALVALLIAWHKNGRDLLSSTELIMLPGYVISKLSIYARAIAGQKLQWVRTKRD